MSTPRVASDPGPRVRSLTLPLSCFRRAAPQPPAWPRLAAVCLALALRPGGGAHAQGPPATVSATVGTHHAGDEEMILTVHANGVPRGEFTLLRKADGDFWLAERDLPKLQMEAVPQARRQSGGENYLSFRAMGASALTYSEADLRLSVLFPVGGLAGTEIDLSSRPQPAVLAQPATSLLLSYRLSARHVGQGNPAQASLDTDLNVRVAGVLLRQETRMVMAGPGRRFTRGASQAIWDDRVNGRRLIAGDVISSAGSYGSTITGGGLLLAKLYELTPDVIKQPTATLQTSSALPAEVEVAVDGSPIYRTQVGPGPITLNNLLLPGGTRNLRVTVTDASGRREVTEQPFLFTDSVLARGLHEYSYFIGRRSELGLDNQWRYREAAWQAFHRYGLNDSLTVAAGGEGNADFVNAGAGLTLRSDTLGLLSLDALASRDRLGPVHANGWSARYTYVAPVASVVLARRQFGAGFRSFQTSAQLPFPREETRVGLTTRIFKATLSADLVHTRDALESRFSRALRLATNIGRRTTLLGEIQSTRVNGRSDWAAYLFLRTELESQRWVGATARAASGSRGFDVETGKQLAQGEGVGYRLGVSSNVTAGRDVRYGYLAANWNLRPATLEFFGTSQLTGDQARYAEVALAGAVVGIDGFWGLTRRVDDGFALARLGVPQAGVEISLNNQVQGTTDAEGNLFIPQVSSIGRQDVSLNDRQLGMQYNIGERRVTVTPPYRSGAVVHFGGRKLRAVAGMAWQVDGGQRLPIASRSWTLAGKQGKLAVDTASAGDFYLEDAAPGSYTGPLELGGKAYSCRLEVPASADAVQELKEGIICE